MASVSSYTDMEEEAKCAICLECLTDPVTLDCGHNFCRGCIADYCDKWVELGDLMCPVCKAEIQKGDFRTNWQLANIVKKVKEKRFCARKPGTEVSDAPHETDVAARKEKFCQKHQEPLKLFCKDDEALICLVCDRSKGHREHKTLPLEEASQEYKDQFRSHLERLKKETERIMACKTDVVKESQDLLKQITEEKQETVANFRQLQAFLEKQETLLLAEIEELEKEVARNRDQHLAELSETLSSLDSLIQEMEEKCQLPASELLLDARSSLQRYEEKGTCENPVGFFHALKWHIWHFQNSNPLLKGIKTQIQDILDSGFQLQKDILDSGFHLQKADVTLDPDTAHRALILSEDGKSVRRGKTAQALPNNPERFHWPPAVLGCEGFTAGRHFWELLVGNEGGWVVGVARKSVRRRGKDSLGPEDGIWAVWKWGDRYSAVIKGHNPSLTLPGKLKRIRVCLNYPGGRMAIFDADRAALLYEFSEVSFSGETLLPFFWVYEKGHLKLSS